MAKSYPGGSGHCDGRPYGPPKDPIEVREHGHDRRAAERWPDAPNLGKDGYGVASAPTSKSSSLLSEGAVEIPKEGASHSGKPDTP